MVKGSRKTSALAIFPSRMGVPKNMIKIDDAKILIRTLLKIFWVSKKNAMSESIPAIIEMIFVVDWSP